MAKKKLILSSFDNWNLRKKIWKSFKYRYIDIYISKFWEQKTRTEKKGLFIDFFSYSVKIFLFTLNILIKFDDSIVNNPC